MIFEAFVPSFFFFFVGNYARQLPKNLIPGPSMRLVRTNKQEQILKHTPHHLRLNVLHGEACQGAENELAELQLLIPPLPPLTTSLAGAGWPIPSLLCNAVRVFPRLLELGKTSNAPKEPYDYHGATAAGLSALSRNTCRKPSHIVPDGRATHQEAANNRFS